MEFLFSLQIGAIFLALLAHFIGFLRARLLGSRMHPRARLFTYARTGLLPEGSIEQAG